MRRTRLRKHRSNFQLFLLIGKVIMIWYLMVFSVTYLTTNTSAYFTNANNTNGIIYAGFWEPVDESSLAFIKNGNENIKTCEPTTLKAEIKNTADGDMQSDSTYDVYYIENGNPEKHGDKMDLGKGEGSIEALKSGETTELTFKASEPGRYAFVAYQHDEHVEEEAWSKSIKINCPPGHQTNTDENIEDKEETTKNNEKQTSEDEKPDEDNAASKEVEENEKEENEENETNTEEKNTKEEGKKDDEGGSEVEENADKEETKEESSNKATTEEEGDEG
ncbi:TasA anchoring/assembly protein [Virgibacillus natechei]|uniref:TasA anchoring/assembly protein n=1 Tax=Virgibacillus natechei TaxID=1216297 RepID=A0ABS4IJQ2_9BACI|nr:amyloid fiber anchoring/assembly protein TapA [Virgibacillus natechei]MBP1971188.1 TasA anchoring/assembly protein [Virgibacillus natechei]UZD11935.1 amyloid fiber anchoring/assembly protein TapA [Virgibacillus natechei]